MARETRKKFWYRKKSFTAGTSGLFSALLFSEIVEFLGDFHENNHERILWYIIRGVNKNSKTLTRVNSEFVVTVC